MKNNVVRPQAQGKKIRYTDNFELCYMRHTYFRKTTHNPTELDMEPYMPITKQLARKTYYRYQNLFKAVGFELSDVINIGRIHLTSFLGLYTLERMDQKYSEFVDISVKKTSKTPSSDDILNKNKANMTIFMKQRMENVVRICRQKARNIKGIKTEEFQAFYGPQKPPTESEILLEDWSDYGFKKIDMAAFKTIKRRAQRKNEEPFQFAGSWYVQVPLDHRPLNVTDFSGAGYDPHDNICNKNPEQLLLERTKEDEFQKYRKAFRGFSKEQKAKLIGEFIEKNRENPVFVKELLIAERLYKNLRG